LPLADSATVLPVLITPVRIADPDALPHLSDVAVWNLEEFRKWARNALSVIRELRSIFPGSGDLAWRATAVEKYRENRMDPERLVEFLRAQPTLKARG
jgi:hypothetical protein